MIVRVRQWERREHSQSFFVVLVDSSLKINFIFFIFCLYSKTSRYYLSPILFVLCYFAIKTFKDSQYRRVVAVRS